MTTNDFLTAVESKLNALWPERTVLFNRNAQGDDGCLYVGITSSNQEKARELRRIRNYDFEVLYILDADDNLEFHNWMDGMYRNFDILQVGDGNKVTLHLKGQSAKKLEKGIYQFVFQLSFLHEPDLVLGTDGEPMENLLQKGDLK